MPMSDIAVLNDGERLALQCAVIKGGLPMTVNWLKDNSAATNVAGVHVKLINDFTASLTVESLTWQHAGRYTCWVRNEGGRAESSVTVIVQGKCSMPRCGYCPAIRAVSVSLVLSIPFGHFDGIMHCTFPTRLDLTKST